MLVFEVLILLASISTAFTRVAPAIENGESVLVGTSVDENAASIPFEFLTDPTFSANRTTRCTVPENLLRSNEQCANVQYSKTPNFIYYGVLISTFLTMSESACAVKCLSNPYCESANFHSDVNLCELNADFRLRDSSNWNYRQGVTYMDTVKCPLIGSVVPASLVNTGAMCGRSDTTPRFNHASIYYAHLLSMPMAQASEARPNSFPWMVSIQQNKVHTCSAVLIHKFYALTSASCFQSSTNPSSYEAVVGEHSLKLFDPLQQLIPIESIIIHQQYSPSNARLNDIALVKFRVAARFDKAAQPICPPDLDIDDHPPKPYEMRRTGDEKLYTECFSFMDRLTAMLIPFIPRSMCNDARMYNGNVQDKMLCAGYVHPLNCMPDIGGPLFCTRNSTWFIVGLASWGEDCIRANKPKVYTSVYQYVDWIRLNTAAAAGMRIP